MADTKNARIGIDETETAHMTPVEGIRSVQLNEKVSDTTYQILHPETDAYQVITNPERRFVSEEEKKKWNKAFELGANALHYVGDYNPDTLYHLYDVVSYQGGDLKQDAEIAHYGDKADLDKRDPQVNGDSGVRFFVYLNQSATAETDGSLAAPPKYDEFIADNWLNFNFESYLAEYAHGIKVETGLEGTFTFGLIDQVTGDYHVVKTSNNFFIEPDKKRIIVGNEVDGIVLDGANGTVTAKKFIGDLQGNADTATRATEAEKYVTYSRDSKHELTEGKRTESGTEYIDDSIAGLHKRIDDIRDGTGGAILSNGLTIQKNGENLNAPFTGATAQTVNITINTQDVKDLLDDKNKIKETWLPDSVIGAMEYIGTFDAATGQMKVDLRGPNVDSEGHTIPGSTRPFQKGDYAIAVVAGNSDPSGAIHAVENAEATYFIVGDWAVYNGDLDNDDTIDAEEWTKVDNTDSVRTVNSQIGDVKTYKGAWVADTQYFAGDIVLAGDPAALYLCVKDSKAAAEAGFDTVITDFVIFGRIYKAADGIELTEEDSTFRHLFKDATDSKVGSQDKPIKLDPKAKVELSKVVLEDKYGHVKTNVTTVYEMPDDTWRPVKVNGQDVQDNTVLSGPLHLKDEMTNDDKRVLVTAISQDLESPEIVISHEKNKIGAGSHVNKTLSKEESAQIKNQIIIGLGSKFTAPDFGWGDTGHVDSYSTAVFELPEDIIKHKHFAVVLAEDENGVKRSTIRSFTAEEYTAQKDKNRLFYDAAPDGLIAVPDSEEQMGFNGIFNAREFYQTGYLDTEKQLHRVIDETARVVSGKNYKNEIIYGNFSKGLNSYEFTLGNSGIHLLDEPVVYSAIAVNKQGISVAGGQILEFGTFTEGPEGSNTGTSSDPSDSLVIGGLFFRNMGPYYKDNNGITTP